MFVRLGDDDVELVVHRPDATDADLARVVGAPVPAVPRPLDDLGLVRGAPLGIGPGAPAAAAPAVTVAVVGGLDAGRRVEVAAGAVVAVGRAAGSDVPLDDLVASRRHLRLAVDGAGRVAVEDLGSRNGTWLLGSAPVAVAEPRLLPPSVDLRAGASRVAVRPAVDADRPLGPPARPLGLVGTVPHNRPPRPALPAPGPAVPVPHPSPPSGSRLPLSVVAVVGPLLMAGVMVWVLGNPAFALFALLAPVLAIGNHVEGGRRERRGSRKQAADWRADLAAFAAALSDAVEVECGRRRAAAVDPAEVVRRAASPSTRLWERRPGHADWLVLRVGVGDLRWTPPLADEAHGARPPDVAAAVAAASVLRDVPATVSLAEGGVIGVVGPRAAALAVARSLLLQAAVHHGPSDLAVLVACPPAAAPAWDAAKWLPHVEDPRSGARRLALGREQADSLAESLLAVPASAPDGGATTLVVVDGDDLLAGRRAPLRSVLTGRAGPVAGIVVAPTADRLPAACTAVLTVDGDGRAELQLPASRERVGPLLADGIGVDVADRCARALARFDDPELDAAGAGLPAVVALSDLLGLPRLSPVAVAERWLAAGADPRPVVPIGVDGAGVVDLDLVRDGPHALVAGTTGAGKSELLRSLVLGLAAGSSPDHLTFVLVDFKGGSAFDACARLPHTVGMVTDLDADLAERALRCLEAELRHRERVLREAGAADLVAHRRLGGDPLPRLVVVVDEFATLKAELPDFVESLVGVAQRGRSLGVHLVLATQRPAGAVSDNIKANTNLRIALRVQDVADSVDVVDLPSAAALPRARPGRACIRLGPGEVLTVQTALATTCSATDRPPVELRPFRFGPGTGVETDGARLDDGPTDLERLVDACVGAFERSGRPAPRRPWPDLLPEALDLADVEDGDHDIAVVGLADEPDQQRRVPAGWRPAQGNLVLHGVGGSGTTTSLLAVARALAAGADPAHRRLFALDLGAGELGALAALPHTVAVVGATERERQQRLVAHLRAELDRRKALPVDARAGLPELVLLLDGVGSFLAEFDDLAGMDVTDAFTRVFLDGPEVGIRAVLTADRAGAVPGALLATVRQRWVHRLADGADAALAGVGRSPSHASLPPGRYVDTATGLVVQVARPVAGWTATFAEVAARWPDAAPPLAGAGGPIEALPVAVDRHGLGSGSLGPARPWRLPVGLGDDLAPAHLVLHVGDHVLVAGPGRAGRTTALATIAAAVLDADPSASVVVLAGRRSWLGAAPGVEVAPDVLGAATAAVGAAGAGRPSFLLVDDAESVDDVDGVLERLLADGRGEVHVVAAARAEVARGLYGHWTRTLRRSRLGVLLRPNVDLDGELLGAVLPRRSRAPWVDGRGFLVVDGEAGVVQVARDPGWQDATP